MDMTKGCDSKRAEPSIAGYGEKPPNSPNGFQQPEGMSTPFAGMSYGNQIFPPRSFGSLCRNRLGDTAHCGRGRTPFLNGLKLQRLPNVPRQLVR